MNTWVSFQSAEQPLLGQFSVSGNIQTNCQNYACVEYQFQGRLLQLGRMKADPAPSAMDAEACLDAWIAAYRQEEGDEVAIIHDQITEWQQWCSGGRLP
ncbi:hypothetical protein [Pseudomonas aeruginosa]|uniref:hypothetical protein n=1 Tax=Pseudomonas aeruginosa TaxID=287 RepID=UPI002935E149|nr:hypothetical protein [Pseudomonas aeruginosa]MDV2877211.1 hypothetical protein [Pseudomonas aeruginosa]